MNILNRVARWFLFKPKILNLGKFWRALDWKILIYFTAIWNILQTFGICYDDFVFLRYIFHRFGLIAPENLATLIRNTPLSLVSTNELVLFSFCLFIEFRLFVAALFLRTVQKVKILRRCKKLMTK
jgi:hypothetical protein